MSYYDLGYTKSDFSTVENCPSNVCCSKWGFCGLVQEFCGNKTVPTPCGTAGKLQRVIVYYEGWSANRPCDALLPEYIPKGVYIHINFAFVSIDLVTFAVVPTSSRDVDLYTRVTQSRRDRSEAVIIPCTLITDEVRRVSIPMESQRKKFARYYLGGQDARCSETLKLH